MRLVRRIAGCLLLITAVIVFVPTFVDAFYYGANLRDYLQGTGAWLVGGLGFSLLIGFQKSPRDWAVCTIARRLSKKGG